MKSREDRTKRKFSALRRPPPPPGPRGRRGRRGARGGGLLAALGAGGRDGGAARGPSGKCVVMRRHAFCGAWPKGARGALAVRCGGGRRGLLKSRRCGGGPQGLRIFNARPGDPGDRVKLNMFQKLLKT